MKKIVLTILSITALSLASSVFAKTAITAKEGNHGKRESLRAELDRVRRDEHRIQNELKELEKELGDHGGATVK